MKLFCYSLLLASLLTAQPSAAQSVSRTGTPAAAVQPTVLHGPYLQQVTPTSIQIRWRTDIPATSRVDLFSDRKKTQKIVSDDKLVTEHEVRLDGLKPATKYFYSFGDKTSVTPADDQFFVTAPKTGATDEVRFWVLGDFGNSSQTQADVRDAVMKESRRPDLWVWLGDNAYSKGKDEEFEKHVFDVYGQTHFKNLPFYCIPGNHDYGGQRTDFNIPYFNLFTMPTAGEAGGVPSGSESYYAFDYGNVHFVALDSYGKLDGTHFLWDTTGRQVEWLKKDLAANKQPWTIVVLHHPPYTKGSHDSDREKDLVAIRQNLVPILERYQVDLVLSGHSHVYERTHPIRGHYGLVDTFEPKNIVSAAVEGDTKEYRVGNGKQGIIYIVAGSGGQRGGQAAGWPMPAAVYSNNTEGGSLLIDVKKTRMQVRWLCQDGKVRDDFSILK
ncbi:metallophosphoesterase [Tellurirhabdus rosea]|uniref:metallophosphoesterase n=1 Tax=Tellurirhabdus rosea TaxID=2674997 RepID=UPI00224F9492|nr:metallophosphoesterase family protein [Tellurirhabdus rosea]